MGVGIAVIVGVAALLTRLPLKTQVQVLVDREAARVTMGVAVGAGKYSKGPKN